MKILFATIVLALFGTVAAAERANLIVQTYGLNLKSDWIFDVKVVAGASMLDRPSELTQRSFDIDVTHKQGGHRLRLQDVHFQPGDHAVLLSISAYQTDATGAKTVEFFFPVHLIDREVRTGENVTFAVRSMRGYSDVNRAARESYPFYDIDDPVSVTDSNIVQVLNAIRELARRSELSEERWNDIHLLIQKNSNLVAQRTDVLRKMVEILNEYKSVNKSDAFVKFYIVFLRKMVLEDLGERIRLDETNLINDYFRDEIILLVSRNPKVAFAEMSQSLESYEKSKDYARCISVASGFQKSIAQSVLTDPDWWRAQNSNLLASSVYAGLIAGTRCAQLSYVESDPNGSQSDVEGGSKYTAEVMFRGQEFIESFVAVVAAFKDAQILSMKNIEVSKFNLFYEHEHSRKMGN